MKLELKKVKDEFKMSESDCGSARVQGKGLLIFKPMLQKTLGAGRGPRRPPFLFSS